MDVFASAMPVSKPAWFVTNGKSRLHWQATIANRLRATDWSQKRGIGADGPAAVTTVLNGANEAFTVVWPGGGRFAATLEMKATPIGMLACSTAAGSAFTTS